MDSNGDLAVDLGDIADPCNPAEVTQSSFCPPGTHGPRGGFLLLRFHGVLGERRREAPAHECVPMDAHCGSGTLWSRLYHLSCLAAAYAQALFCVRNCRIHLIPILPFVRRQAKPAMPRLREAGRGWVESLRPLRQDAFTFSRRQFELAEVPRAVPSPNRRMRRSDDSGRESRFPDTING
jgi:hypothetical protein